MYGLFCSAFSNSPDLRLGREEGSTLMVTLVPGAAVLERHQCFKTRKEVVWVYLKEGAFAWLDMVGSVKRVESYGKRFV
jgi:hypothetical protein